MLIQLLVGTGLIIACVINHAVCLELLLRRLKSIGPRWDRRLPTYGHIVIMIIVVLGLFAAHTIEAWLWAMFYWGSGELSGLPEALYFSTVTFTTLGYGDVILSEKWNLTASLQAVSGILLFGWSTAFLINIRAFFWNKYGIDHYQG
ncbi:MAG: ion transporter [Sneathiella sp.]|uniref:potassium channel family protein n=1 Tax=Sneathiella sp. TaxID=1964365 RepID=UPI000C5B6CFA|nr:potassium channel family protein [Sneathiella sp.]MAZ02785.1 ion transporter [Sneathiella sp.]